MCCGEMSTYYGTSQKAGQTWACKHHVSICAHTLAYTSTLNAEGKVQLFVCLGGFATSVTTYSKKKSFCYLKHTHVNNKGLIQLAMYLYFLLK